jgi:ribosome-associated toxin RatA of RatAB toxin-antitoxin module
LAFGLKFNAKAILDCYERDLQTLASGEKRDIEFKMTEGDFQFFEGKWSIEQVRISCFLVVQHLRIHWL